MSKIRRILLLVGGGVLLLGVLLFFAVQAGLRVGEASKEAALIERHRKDSLQEIQDRLTRYLFLGDSLVGQHEYDSALTVCNQILVIDSTQAEVYRMRGDVFRLRKKYADAISEYTEAISRNQKSGRSWYERAVCHTKQKKKKEAVADLRQAIELKYPGADSLHEKINPLLKKVSGSHTVCCDGSISYSTGRGTCSHHGGVCGTEYEYTTYREY